MFKRMFTMIMVMAMIISTFALSAGAVCVSEEGRPDIIGMEYYNTVNEISELYEKESRDPDYSITMTHVEGYWVVTLDGWADEYRDYTAYGIYDHYPTKEEIDIQWTNRMTDDEYDNLMTEKYGIDEKGIGPVTGAIPFLFAFAIKTRPIMRN